MLLDIEDLIGGLAEQEERIKPPQPKGKGGSMGALPSGKPPKHERLGMTSHKMKQSQTIHKNPEIVARVKAQDALESIILKKPYQDTTRGQSGEGSASSRTTQRNL